MVILTKAGIDVLSWCIIDNKLLLSFKLSKISHITHTKSLPHIYYGTGPYLQISQVQNIGPPIWAVITQWGFCWLFIASDTLYDIWCGEHQRIYLDGLGGVDY